MDILRVKLIELCDIEKPIHNCNGINRTWINSQKSLNIISICYSILDLDIGLVEG